MTDNKKDSGMVYSPWVDVRSYGATPADLTDAWNAAIAAGETCLYIPAGIWNSAGMLNTVNGLRVRGAGKFATIINSAFPGVAFQGYGVVRTQVEFSDFSVFCNNQPNSQAFYFDQAGNSKIKIQNVGVFNSQKTPIYVSGTDIAVIDCYVDGSLTVSFSVGIWIGAATDAIVRGNTVINMTDNGIQAGGSGSLDGHIIIEGNIVYGNGRAAAQANGGQITAYNEKNGCANVIISNNIARDGGPNAAGIEVTCDNCLVSGNIVHDNAGDVGIVINSAGAVGSTSKINSIIGNIAYANGSDGIAVRGGMKGFVISGNQSYGNKGYGLNINPGASGGVVFGNNLAGNTRGALLDQGVATMKTGLTWNKLS